MPKNLVHIKTMQLPFATALFCVASGAAIGASLRWLIGIWVPLQVWAFPLATLLANCIGGFLMGITVYYFSKSPNETLRLFVATGVLGGFTTFSAFSAESLLLLQRGFYTSMLMHSGLHVLGALFCSILGFALAEKMLA